MSFASAMAAAAVSLIDEFGGEATITRTRAGTLDPVTRTMSGQTVATIAAKAVREDRRVWADAGRIVTETVLLTTTETLVGDVVTFGGQTLRVVRVSTVAPSGEPIVFEATVSL